MIKVKRKVQFVRQARGRRVAKPVTEEVPAPPPGRVPRVSRLMALAIRFDGLIRKGKVTDQSDLARLAHVTQPRMTQIMNLNHLAPDIQEQLLFLPLVTQGRDRIHERLLRPITAETDWRVQRARWSALWLRHGTSEADPNFHRACELRENGPGT